MKKPPAARLLYAASETDADILYPTGFFAPDPFLFIQKGRTRILVMSDLEVDRARNLLADLEQQAVSARQQWRIASARLTLTTKRVVRDIGCSLGEKLRCRIQERGARGKAGSPTVTKL